jgi:molybdopterin converting factor subunit 1
MNITLLYFAQLREKVATSKERLELPPGSTVHDLRRRLIELHPQIGAALPGVAIAVNMEYAEDERILANGDSVALIPPVSGGC